MILPFVARSRLRWPGLPHDEGGAPRYYPQAVRALELVDRYHLSCYQGLWSRGTWRTVLGTLDLLDRVPIGGCRDSFLNHSHSMSVLDVGSSHWRYVGALAAWLRSLGARGARITGVELDAYRLYRNLRTPAALARYHARIVGEGLGEIRYVEGSAEDIQGKFDWVTWFFPFLFEGTARAWGLPASVFRPEALTRSVFERLSPGGICIFANQGEAEFEALHSLLLRAAPGASCVWQTRIAESLHAAVHPLFISLWLARPFERLDP